MAELHTPKLFEVDAVHTAPGYFKLTNAKGDLITTHSKEEKDYLADLFEEAPGLHRHMLELRKILFQFTAPDSQITNEECANKISAALNAKSLEEIMFKLPDR
jgi:hypothetical protein